MTEGIGTLSSIRIILIFGLALLMHQDCHRLPMAEMHYIGRTHCEVLQLSLGNLGLYRQNMMIGFIYWKYNVLLYVL